MESGRIELILGPMFSGKTSELIRRIRMATIAQQTVVLIKYIGDNRYESGNCIATHDDIRQFTTPNITVNVADHLATVDVSSATVVGIDEGQFYPDLIVCTEKWASEGRRVIISALDGDFMRRPFGDVCALIPRSECVVKYQGICMSCRKRESSFTQRISHSTELVEIGTQNMYRAVCRECYFKA
jgi:thymidine kinase